MKATLRYQIARQLSSVQTVLDGLHVDRPRRNIFRRICRGSQVKFDDQDRWIVDLQPAGGLRLGCYCSRSVALEAEAMRYKANWLPRSMRTSAYRIVIIMFFDRRTLLRITAISMSSLSGIPLQAMKAPNGKESHLLDANWPTLDPKYYPERCQISGVALGKDGNLLVLNRGENPWMPTTGFKQQPIKKPTVLIVDAATGKLTGSWGMGIFVMPHQISVDATGNIWIVDCGSNKIVEFDTMGKKLMEIGGASIGFRKPTDVAFLSDGTFVVSDGYTNSRVVKFSAAGKITAVWGTKGTDALQFQTPHSVAVDDKDLIYVADRENHRIQVLNAQGKVQTIWKNVERPLTVRFHAGHLYVLSNLDADQGIVRKLNKEGEVISAFHTKPAETKEDFEWPHGLAVNADGSEVYVGFTLTGRRVQRYKQVMS